jgi:hypothetical protein
VGDSLRVRPRLPGGDIGRYEFAKARKGGAIRHDSGILERPSLGIARVTLPVSHCPGSG